jgi:hypothetical protein
MVDNFEKLINKNRLPGNDFCGLDEDKKEAFVLTKAIYHSRVTDKHGKPQYFLSNEEVDYVSKRALDKYGLDVIQKFYNKMKNDDLLGKRSDFSLHSMEHDIDVFLGKKIEKKQLQEEPKENPDDITCRYLHLIYFDFLTDDDMFGKKISGKIVDLNRMLLKKYTHKDLEILMDYCMQHNLLNKQPNWTFATVENDIRIAIKWAQENPEKYQQ